MYLQNFQILREGMNRSAIFDAIQINITSGVILSTPSILFPSRSCPRPSESVLREAIHALAAHLIQIAHQESAVRSLSKIRELLGEDELAAFLFEVDDKMYHNFELLCDVYGVETRLLGKNFKMQRDKSLKPSVRGKRRGSLEESPRNSYGGGTEVVEKTIVGKTDAAGRVLLQSEIKFDQATAITMTILEDESNKTAREIEKYEADDVPPMISRRRTARYLQTVWFFKIFIRTQ